MSIPRILLLSAALLGHAHAFEFLGARSGQTLAEATSALTSAGYITEPAEQGLVRFNGPNESGWALICSTGLSQLSITKPYQEFPSLLQAAFKVHGSGGLIVAPSGVSASEQYVTHHWSKAGEAYSLTLIASNAFAPSEVRETWGIINSCASSAPNKSFKADKVPLRGTLRP